MNINLDSTSELFLSKIERARVERVARSNTTWQWEINIPCQLHCLGNKHNLANYKLITNDSYSRKFHSPPLYYNRHTPRKEQLLLVAIETTGLFRQCLAGCIPLTNPFFGVTFAHAPSEIRLLLAEVDLAAMICSTQAFSIMLHLRSKQEQQVKVKSLLKAFCQTLISRYSNQWLSNR